MSRRELLVEHYYNKRFLKSRRFKSNQSQVIFGSSPSADIRLMGQDVNGIHALVEHVDDTWLLMDLASPTGTRVDGENIIEKTIQEPTSVRIGSHEIRLIPIHIESTLFKPEETPAAQAGETLHQVVVRRNGEILRTAVLKPQESFIWGAQDMIFAPPTTREWVVSRFDGLSVQQRLTSAPQVELEKVKLQLTESEKISLVGVGTFALLCFLLLVLKPATEAKPLQEQSNVYAKMVLDPEVLKEKRNDAQQNRRKLVQQKVAKTAQQKAGPTSKIPSKAAPSSGAPTARVQDGPKVLTNIRTAQLGQIIGRISQRADSSRGLASAQGPNAPTSSSRLRGSGLPSVEGSGVKRGNGTAASSPYQIAAVGTSGRGGGVSDFKGVGSLSSGSVGTADVGIMEDEAEVDGGLDREVIANYIKSQLGQIRYCYERQLSANPDLYGKVQIQFTIAAHGGVSAHSIGQTTLKDATVEGCILRRVAQWKFPEPKGGTQVKVTYPFLFKSTN